MLLLNLSFMEILSSVSMMVYWFGGYFQFCNLRTVSRPDSLSVGCTLHFITGWYLYLLVLLSPMTFLPDRFLAVTFPFRYLKMLPKRKAKYIVIAQWILAATLVTQLVFVSHKHWLKYLQCTAIAIEVMVFGSASVTYSWIVYKIRKHGNLISRTNAEMRVLQVAFLIILTFLCFVVLPQVTLFILIKFTSEWPIPIKGFSILLHALINQSTHLHFGIFSLTSVTQTTKKAENT